LEGLHNLLYYLKRLYGRVYLEWFNSLVLCRTFFATFTFTKRLWDLFVNILQTLYATRLNFQNKIEFFKSIHITKHIQINLITCARYYDHKTSSFCKLMMKYRYSFQFIYKFFSLLKNFKIVVMNMTMEFYGLITHSCIKWTQIKKLNGFTTTDFGFCNWPLQLHISQEGHMHLVINELLNPCCFTHLFVRDVQLQSLVVLMTMILISFIIMKFHVIINLGMMCKVHDIST
jgi:hypothetical protein